MFQRSLFLQQGEGHQVQTRERWGSGRVLHTDRSPVRRSSPVGWGNVHWNMSASPRKRDHFEWLSVFLISDPEACNNQHQKTCQPVLLTNRKYEYFLVTERWKCASALIKLSHVWPINYMFLPDESSFGTTTWSHKEPCLTGVYFFGCCYESTLSVVSIILCCCALCVAHERHEKKSSPHMKENHLFELCVGAGVQIYEIFNKTVTSRKGSSKFITF